MSFAALAQQPTQTPAQPQAPQQQQQPAQRITPDQLWAAILNGNKAFVAGKLAYDDLVERRNLLRSGQVPPISVLACSDSRVPPELVFNQSLGIFFVVRTAGNIADDFGVGSIEFAILNGYTRVLVVMAHSDCGAVKAALGGADPNVPALAELAKRIRMSFVNLPYDSRNPDNVRKATELNARASAAHLMASSKVIRDAVITEQVKMVIAYYDLATGEVKALQ